jgi:hypothetical protein
MFPGLDNPATMTLAPQGTPFFETTYGNLRRVSGWRINCLNPVVERMVVRGGFGIFTILALGPLRPHSTALTFHIARRKWLLIHHFLLPRTFTPAPVHHYAPYPTLFALILI